MLGKHGVTQQGVMGQKENLLKTEYNRIAKKHLNFLGMWKAPGLAKKCGDFHPVSYDSKDPIHYPEVEDVTQISFVQLKHMMIFLIFFFQHK